MKICLISHSSGMGGAERSLLELIDVLKAEGIKLHVFLPSNGPFAAELESRKVSFTIFPYKKWVSKNSPLWKRIARTVFNFVMMIPIAVIIARRKCDIIYTNTVTVCVGGLAAKVLRRPHIWSIREFGYEDHQLIYDLGERLSMWLIDSLSSVCIVNSYAIAKKYSQTIPKQKIKVVYQSVDIKKSYKKAKITLIDSNQDDIKCLIVGTLQRGKRQDEAIKAIKELVSKKIRARLYIVGDGNPDYKRFLKKLIERNGLKEYVHFLGYVDNPVQIMQRVDVVLVCSRAEAFGRVTVEAMKAGKPVIGARSGGTEELIQNGINGLLYTPGNYKELAEKIMYLYKHPEVAEKIGTNGQKWAETIFTQDCYRNEMFSILKQIRNYEKLSKK